MTPYGEECWHMNVRKWNLYPGGPTAGGGPRFMRIPRGKDWYFRSMPKNARQTRAARKRARRQGKEQAHAAE